MVWFRNRRGIQFGFEVEDRPGSIKVLTDTIRQYGGRMASVLTSYDMAQEGFRRVYIRMHGIDRLKLNRIKFSNQAIKESLNMLEAFIPYHLGKETKSLRFLKQVSSFRAPH